MSEDTNKNYTALAVELNTAEAVIQPKIPFSTFLDDKSILVALEKLGITLATDVQARSIPEALLGKDIVVQAQTGSGKTFAFSIPIILQLKNLINTVGTQALILAPTRELALQVKDAISSIAPDFQPACLIGGRKESLNVKELETDDRIVVGTPGRVLDFIKQRQVDLRQCKYFVLDEADEMLGVGFLQDVQSILSKLPKQRQGYFFSATITPRVVSLARSFLTEPKFITIETEADTAPEIQHLFVKVDNGVACKADAMHAILQKEKPESCLIFCNTKSDSELLEILLRKRGVESARFNSDLSQAQREKMLEKFRSGALKILIGTDIAARGIDVKHLDLVINYSIHDQPETYVHRTGRTGRAGRPGRAISLIGPQDFSAFHSLNKNMSIPMTEMSL